MRDLEIFQDVDPGPMPSAHEIRRHGDRRRRRNGALMTAAAAVGVAALVTPLAVLGGGDERTAPDPAEPTVLTRVPDDLPIAFELPAENGDGTPVRVTETPGVTDLVVCGEAVWTPDDVADVAGTTYVGPDDAGTARTVAVYADAASARAAVDTIRDRLGDGCAVEAETWTAEDPTHDGVAYRHASAGGATTDVVEVDRFANALYLDATDERALDVGRADGRLLDAMRVFEGDDVPRLEGQLVPDASLYADAVPGLGLLPDGDVLAGLGPWRAVDDGDQPVDPCRPPIDLARLGPSTRYIGRYVAGSEVDEQAVAWIAVAQFADSAAARTAADRLAMWRSGPCGATAERPDDEEPRVSVDSTFDRSRFVINVTAPRTDGPTRSYRLAAGIEGRLMALVSYSTMHGGSDASSLREEASDLVEVVLRGQ